MQRGFPASQSSTPFVIGSKISPPSIMTKGCPPHRGSRRALRQVPRIPCACHHFRFLWSLSLFQPIKSASARFLQRRFQIDRVDHIWRSSDKLPTIVDLLFMTISACSSRSKSRRVGPKNVRVLTYLGPPYQSKVVKLASAGRRVEAEAPPLLWPKGTSVENLSNFRPFPPLFVQP